MHEVCCGLDVHKKSVTACVLWASSRPRQTREFGTFTKDLLALGDWLRSCGVTHVAMESTGVYWKPVWNLLEGQFLLRELLDHLYFVESKIRRIEQKMEERLGPFPSEVARLGTIPGVDRVTAWGLLAEMGLNMEPFPDAPHRASWAGLCPGSHASAGKRQSGKIRKGSLWLRRCLCQGAWAVSTKKGNYLSALFRRLAARRGKKRATIAVAHNRLVIA
ncbi:MAG: transposase, partial [Candidatus Acidiferrales bacterium]